MSDYREEGRRQFTVAKKNRNRSVGPYQIMGAVAIGVLASLGGMKYGYDRQGNLDQTVIDQLQAQLNQKNRQIGVVDLDCETDATSRKVQVATDSDNPLRIYDETILPEGMGILLRSQAGEEHFEDGVKIRTPRRREVLIVRRDLSRDPSDGKTRYIIETSCSDIPYSPTNPDPVPTQQP